MGYYSELKKEEILSPAMTWMKFGDVINQLWKDKYCMIPLICVILNSQIHRSSRMVVTSSWGEKEMESCCLMGIVSVLKDEKIPKISYTTIWICLTQIVQFSCSVMSNSLWPHGLQQARLSCPSPTPIAYSNPCPSHWHHPTTSSSVVSFSSAFNLSQHQGLFRWVSSSHQVAKGLEFQLQHQSFQWIFRTDLL